MPASTDLATTDAQAVTEAAERYFEARHAAAKAGLEESRVVLEAAYKRKINYRSGDPLTADEARQIFQAACGHGARAGRDLLEAIAAFKETIETMEAVHRGLRAAGHDVPALPEQVATPAVIALAAVTKPTAPC